MIRINLLMSFAGVDEAFSLHERESNTLANFKAGFVLTRADSSLDFILNNSEIIVKLVIYTCNHN